jgi:leader peptidase (prepilin peptidase)/N-methyltransferase
LGSFLAALCLRWPAGESVASGRSRCDSCQRTLRAIELVPLLSALWSGQRCRSCGAKIDPAHGQIELAALLAGAAPFLFLPVMAAASWAGMAWLLIPLIWLDHRYLWLPNVLLLLLAIGGLLVGGVLSGEPLTARLIGGAAGFASLAILAAGFRFFRGKNGMGDGDPKMLGALGLWLGWQALPFLLVLASAFGLAAALLRARNQSLREQKIALGAVMGLAAMLIGLVAPPA